MTVRPKITYPVVLLVLIAAVLVNTFIWIRIDTRPPPWDEAHYLTMSLQYHRALCSDGVIGLLSALAAVDPVRPPLVPALAVPMYFLFGKSPDAALAVNLIAFVVLILAVYGLGTRLASRGVGVFAAFLVSTFPPTLGLARLFMLDFCDVALVAAALYVLLTTDNFSIRGRSLAFGAVAGLGLLTRAFFPVFIIGPLAVTAYVTWRRGTRGADALAHERHRARYIGLAFLACASVAGPWYLTNLIPLVRRSFAAAYGAEAVGYGPANPWTAHAILSYLITFINVSTTLAGMGFFLLGGALLFVKRATLRPSLSATGVYSTEGLALLISSVLIPYGVFSTLPSHDLKNIAPILPAMSVISAWGLSLLQPLLLRNVVVSLVVMISVFQAWLGTYGISSLRHSVAIPLSANLPPLVIYRQAATSLDEGFLLLPLQENWKIPDILSVIAKTADRPGGMRSEDQPVAVGILPNHAFFNGNTFTYFAKLAQLPLSMTHPGDPRWPGGKDYRTHLLAFDIVVAKTSNPGPAWLNSNNAAMIEFVRSPDSGFVELSPRFDLPDGSQAVLYASGGDPAVREPYLKFSTPVTFNDQVELLGYNLEEKGMTSQGRAFLVTYYWRALQEVTEDYKVFVHVTETNRAQVITGWDHWPVRGRRPTSRWRPGTVIEDRGLYFLPADLLPGSYLIRIGLYLPASGQRSKVTQADSEIALDEEASRASIGTIRVH